MQLSHSRIEKFKSCPKSYDLYYNQKIRPLTTTSALFFGSKLGLVMGAICLRKKSDLTPDEAREVELGQDPKQYFDQLLETVEINNKVEPLDISPNVRYFRKDYDTRILTDEDSQELNAYTEEKGLYIEGRLATFEDFIEEYLTNQITDPDILSFMNLHFFLSLRRKGLMMIDEFLNNFYHKIVKVYSIEREIRIDMSLEGEPEFTDFMLGYIDMECDYKLCEVYDKNILKPYINLHKELDKVNKKVEKLHKKCETKEEYKTELKEMLQKVEEITTQMSKEFNPGDIIRMTADFKTSASRYGTKRLTESSQLARYNLVAQNPYQGYIVLVKDLKQPKKGVRTGELYPDIQVLFGNRDEELENSVLDEDEVILEKIQNGEFPGIPTKECERQYGKFCQYYWLCHENSMLGLTCTKK